MKQTVKAILNERYLCYYFRNLGNNSTRNFDILILGFEILILSCNGYVSYSNFKFLYIS